MLLNHLDRTSVTCRIIHCITTSAIKCPLRKAQRNFEDQFKLGEGSNFQPEIGGAYKRYFKLTPAETDSIKQPVYVDCDGCEYTLLRRESSEISTRIQQDKSCEELCSTGRV